MTPNPLSRLPRYAVIGHRGNRAHAPENTLRSLGEALALGAHGLEFDVRLTRDGEAVVLHDATLDRTTDGRGLLAAHTWDEVRRLDAGARFTSDGGATFPFRGQGIGVPRLSDVLAAFPEATMIVEIKEAEASAAVARLIRDHGAADRCTVGAFRHATIAPFDGGPVARAASTREAMRLYVPALLGRRCTALPFQAMTLPPSHRGVPVPLRKLARAVAPAGVPVFAWTINQPEQALRLWRGGLHGVISDDPALLLRARPAP